MAARKRRPAGRPPGHGEDIVESILQATLQHLAKYGFVGLSIAQVASNAGLTKTTVYRRYPTKEKLFVAAVRRLVGTRAQVRASGRTRTDLLRAMKAKAALAWQPEERAIATSILGVDDPGLRFVTSQLHDDSVSPTRAALDRAISQRELRADADAAIAAEVLNAFIAYRAFWLKVPIDAPSIDAVVDLVLAGLAARPSRPAAKRPLKRSRSAR
jgi:AcrR family transcriptional regulator